MRRGVLLVCAGVAGGTAAACGLTASFAGLQGGHAATDAGPDASEPLVDGSAPFDAGSDATTADAGDAGPHFCATLTAPVKLCDDFDEGQPIEAGWNTADLYGGQAVSIDTTSAFSPPASFLSVINPTANPESARLLETLPTNATHVHVEFEMLLTPTVNGTEQLCVVHEVTSDGTTYGLYYQEQDGALVVQLRALESDDSTVFDQSWPIGTAPATPSWTHVTIDMDVADAGSFTVAQNGTTVVTQSSVPTSTPSRTAFFVELGLYDFDPGSGQANFDNAIVDWK